MDLTRFWALLDALPAPADAEALYDATTPQGALRRANLERYLALVAGTGTALIAEAPGWRGATVTGVPFVSVRELTVRPGRLTGRADGDGFLVPPQPAAEWEASAAFVQRALAAWPGRPPVCWGAYPHHPFVSGDPRTNRTPRPAEVRGGAPVALELLAALGIRDVVAVGRKAQGALAAAGIEAVAVRHPAQGGATLFAAQMAALAAART
ncbi:uracil-DNA glycosylase [Amnibacterium sp. CER49]|uniref:uracil-DNA glycosylase n=1 Tax=Amnibacterium sp. CER49 TaxID=3039161 RepID=UPI0024468F01|nr:uracil-DNA glycosylase [Amnibacterium sp. CER49]MDH2444243.1 uracil-DNA glycosylase [Amnibacterium sp. CER49]